MLGVCFTTVDVGTFLFIVLGILWTHLSKYPVLSAQSCLTHEDPMDCSPPGSSVHGILQARTLGWVAIPFSRDLPYLGIEPRSHTLQADSLPSEQSGKPTWSLALRNTFVHFPNSFFGIPISQMLHFLDQNLSCVVFSSYFLSFSLFLLPSGDSLDFINQTFNSLLILAVSLLLFKNLLSLQQLLLFLVATSSQTFQQKF